MATDPEKEPTATDPEQVATDPDNELSWKGHVAGAVLSLVGALMVWFWASFTAWESEYALAVLREARGQKIFNNILLFPHDTFGPVLGALMVLLLGLVPLCYFVRHVVQAVRKYGK